MSSKCHHQIIRSAACPRKWNDFFDANFTVEIQNRGKFDCYSKGTKGPLLLYLHCAGSCALTFAVLCKRISAMVKNTCKQLSISLRGHGKTYTNADDEYLIKTYAEDVQCILQSLYPNGLPDIVLIGHLLGGIVNIALCTSLHSVIALVVIDSVEEMNEAFLLTSLISQYPKTFRSLEEAIIWHVKNNLNENIYSASVSIPGFLLNTITQEVASDEVARKVQDERKSLNTVDKATMGSTFVDELDIDISDSMFQDGYSFRTNMVEISSHFQEWLHGLSPKFLAISAPKQLILSKTTLLNPVLVKGQMVGKFNCDIIPANGIFLHEEKPEVVAEIIVNFLKSNANLFKNV